MLGTITSAQVSESLPVFPGSKSFASRDEETVGSHLQITCKSLHHLGTLVGKSLGIEVTLTEESNRDVSFSFTT